VGFSDWITVLNYLKSRVDAGDLWVETPQRVTKYMMERDNYTVSVTADNGSAMTIEFNTSAEINPSPMVANSVYSDSLTLVITTRYNQSVRVNAAPFGGAITVQYGAGGVTSVTQNGVPLQEIPVGVAQARSTLRAERSAGTALARQPSGILVRNPSGRPVTVRVYALSGQCVVEAQVTGPGNSVATNGLAPGLYTAVAGSASIAFAVQARGR